MKNRLFAGLLLADDAIGKFTPPPFIKPGIDATGKLTGIMVFFNSLLKLVFIVAGLWAFINILMAGYGYISAGGDAKAITKATDRIWQSFVGLLVIVSSFLLAAIVGILLFGDAGAILKPTLGIK